MSATITTAVDRALLEQHGLKIDGHDTNDGGAPVEVWNVSDRVQLVISGAGAHFVIDGHDTSHIMAPVSRALAALVQLRVASPGTYGSNKQ